MRIHNSLAAFIKQRVQKYFGANARVYLFGSRANDFEKGGDIDLYVETDSKGPVFERKIKLLQDLYNKIGEQKIDIVINNFSDNLYIYKVARHEGVLL